MSEERRALRILAQLEARRRAIISMRIQQAIMVLVITVAAVAIGALVYGEYIHYLQYQHDRAHELYNVTCYQNGREVYSQYVRDYSLGYWLEIETDQRVKLNFSECAIRAIPE